MTGLRKRLESACRKALFDFDLLSGVSRLAVGLSGGKDSLSMLYLLHAISGRGFPELEITAVHVEGEYSCGASVDRKYLKTICDELNIPLLFRQSTQTLESLNCYRCSRERRRLIFDAAKSVGADVVALGHHRDDQAQTVLLNLLHKGEFAGNLPKLKMIDYGITIIRPLIYIAERDLVSFAKEQGFARISCRCPVGQRSKRKEVDELLSEIETLFPNARNNVAQAGLVYGTDKARKISRK